MEEQHQAKTWSNAGTVGINTILFCMFPVLFFIGFSEKGSIASLITGIVLVYLVYELTVFSFIRIICLNEVLEFRKPLRKYSLLFRKKDHHLRISPDEWTTVYRYSFKGGKSYYFRNGQTAAYFVSTDGLSNFYHDLKKLFPDRVKEGDDFPRQTKKRMKKEWPGRVF